jgi:type IV secretory pathway VirJ component
MGHVLHARHHYHNAEPETLACEPHRVDRVGSRRAFRHTALVLRLSKLLPPILLAALLATAAVRVAQCWPRVLDTPELGLVRTFPAWLQQRGIAYVFSGADGWQPEDEQAANALARAGNFVAGIDTPRLLARLNQRTPGCVFMPGMLENYSHAQQRAAGTRRYEEPALFGRGIGASLVYLAQIQAPPLAFDAAVMLDPEPALALVPPLCDHPAPRRDAAQQALRPEALGGNVPARVWLDAAASGAARAFGAALIPAGTSPPATGALSALYESGLRGIKAEQQRGEIGDLPLIEVVAPHPVGELFAILYSGDGGWRDLDRSLAGVLASKGVSVVGVDVLRYYWRSRSPDVAAADLARIMHYYQQRWGRQRVALIGFSFGADVLPFLVNRLPPPMRAEVKLISLLSPERDTAFEVEPTGWLGRQADAVIPIEPELKKMQTLHVQCIFGADEADDSLCTTPSAAALDVLRKPGGHHFDQNYDELADAILAAAAR